MGLPFKLFYSLEELAQREWCGFSSVDEILHTAAVGHIPLCVLLVEGRYCYYSTLHRFFTDIYTESTAIHDDKQTYSEYLNVSKDCFQYDYPLLIARVKLGAIFEFIFKKKDESYTDYLMSYFYNSDEINEVDTKIVKVDMEESPLPLPIQLKKENFVIDREDANQYEKTKNSNRQTGHQNDISLKENTASKRTENTNLKIIGALVSIVREQTDFKSQAQIIEHIINHDQFKRIPGLSSRTMQDRFSQANTALKDAGD